MGSPSSPTDERGHRFGPRQRELLDGWKHTVERKPQGLGYDFTAPPTRLELERNIDTLVTDPTTEAFRNVWAVLRRTTTPYSYVLGTTDSIESLADLVEEIHEAETWEPEWTEGSSSPTWLYELFTRTHREYPIIDTFTKNYLLKFGLRIEDDFSGHLHGMERFQEAYESTVGHMTAGTDYEVPITRELDELFGLLHQVSPSELPTRLLGRETPVYEPLIGFHGTDHDGGRIELDTTLVNRAIDAYAEGVRAGAYGIDTSLSDSEREQYWCGAFQEVWKHRAAERVSQVLRTEVGRADLSPDDLDTVLGVFDEGHGVISGSVLQYLLSPQQGWRVWQAFKDSVEADPEAAAVVLSRLFNPESEYVTGRLDSFRQYFEDDDSLRAGSLMKLATGMLMLAHPQRYVIYQYGRCSSFFSDVCVSQFDVETGYNPTQYHRINAAADELRDRLNETLDREATMCDVQSIFYFWAERPLT